MAFDIGRALRGAGAGAIAAIVWAAQQDTDKRVFGVDYDDTELLGKFVTRGDAWRPIGLAMHVANGAVFGAIYASVAHKAPGPGWAKGATAGMAEHLGSWPFVGLVERFHPARKDFPTLAGDPAAFAQATWRHLLFGVLLGVMEERFNAVAPDPRFPAGEPPASSNGHGDISRAVPQEQ